MSSISHRMGDANIWYSMQMVAFAAEPATTSHHTSDWPLFVAMLLGMIVKAGVDLLDAPDKSLKKDPLRNAVVAVLVSPIVFLGFLNVGQFSASPQTFIVLWLLAFQNGFFWQTVLKRNVQKNNQENPSK